MLGFSKPFPCPFALRLLLFQEGRQTLELRLRARDGRPRLQLVAARVGRFFLGLRDFLLPIPNLRADLLQRLSQSRKGRRDARGLQIHLVSGVASRDAVAGSHQRLRADRFQIALESGESRPRGRRPAVRFLARERPGPGVGDRPLEALVQLGELPLVPFPLGGDVASLPLEGGSA